MVPEYRYCTFPFSKVCRHYQIKPPTVYSNILLFFRLYGKQECFCDKIGKFYKILNPKNTPVFRILVV